MKLNFHGLLATAKIILRLKFGWNVALRNKVISFLLKLKRVKLKMNGLLTLNKFEVFFDKFDVHIVYF